MFKIDGREVDLMNIGMSKHFRKRVEERFFITDGKLKRKFFIDIVTNGQYLGLQFDKDCADSNASHMFVKDGVAVFLSQHNYILITTYRADIGYYQTVKEKVLPVFKSKLNSIKKTYNRKKKEVYLNTLDIDEEIIQKKRELFFARSQTKKNAIQAYINALEEQKVIIDRDREKVAQEYKDLTHAVACFV